MATNTVNMMQKGLPIPTRKPSSQIPQFPLNSSHTKRAAAGSGMVASAFGAASEAGAAMLRAGGNAIDAACATAWALSVCEPAESGLGGQTTMIVRFADDRCIVLDGHSHAPANLSRKLVGRRAQKRGHTAAVIPSTVRTLGEAQSRYGRLSLSQVLSPAIALAEDGYAITALQRHQQRWTARELRKFPDSANLFLGPSGKPFRVGETFRQPVLAETLRRISAAGTEDFYTGGLARTIADDMARHGGLITLADLVAARFPIQREAMSITYRGRRVLSVPPPGGGGQILLSLQILQHLAPGTNNAWTDTDVWRADLIRAALCSLSERERWPDHPEDMDPSLAHWMVSQERAARLVASIRAGDPGPPVRDLTGEEGNTTHLCTADGEGTVVSLTQSIQSVFGAKVACAPLGFVYNNYLSTCPRDAHRYRLGPGCLPQSNAAPTIVLRPARLPTPDPGSVPSPWEPLLAIGAAGSRRIVSSVTSVISAVVDRGMSIGEAVAMPRAHALLSGRLWYEPGAVTPRVRRSLRPRVVAARELEDLSYKLGAVQALEWDADGSIEGASDPRRDGRVSVDPMDTPVAHRTK